MKAFPEIIPGFSLPAEYQIRASADSRAFTCSSWYGTLIFAM